MQKVNYRMGCPFLGVSVPLWQGPVAQVPSRFAGGLVFRLALALLLAAGLCAAQTKRKTPPAQPLDLNAATLDQLQQLPEVGPKLAAAIVRFREKSGAFRRVEDLLAVPGITRRRLAKIRPFVFVKETGKQEGKPQNRGVAPGL